MIFESDIMHDANTVEFIKETANSINRVYARAFFKEGLKAGVRKYAWWKRWHSVCWHNRLNIKTGLDELEKEKE